MSQPMFTPEATFLTVLRSLLQAIAKLVYFLKPASERRYIQLTPATCTIQRLYDRKAGKVLRFVIRNFVDFSTLSQVYLVEDYAIERLRRHVELRARYERILAEGRIPLIVDCGGNIGLASRYFSENFPEADIICIEPDAANVAIARANNHSPRVRFIQAAIGSESGRGAIANPGAWSNALQVKREEQGELSIITVDDVLERHGSATHEPYLIKIDIEGFEAELFARNTAWIERFPLLAIELHDWMLARSASSANFLRAVAPLGRDFVLQRENIWSLSNH